MFILKNVYKIFENKKNNVIALNNINLEFPKQGLISLVGRNGCGKSTLLGLLSGLIEPTNGEIIIKEVEKKSGKSVALVLQESHFADYLSIENNILLSIDKNTIIKNATFFDELDINNFLSRRPKTLSGGQKQKISLVRSLLRDYSVLLVDEPTSSLDEQTETMIFDYLKEVSKEKLVIVVSHNLELVYKYSDSIIELIEGEVYSVKHLEKQKNQSNVHCLSKAKSYMDYSWVDIKEDVHRNGTVLLIDESLFLNNDRNSYPIKIVPTNNNNNTIDIHKNKKIIISSILNSIIKIFSFSILTSIFIIIFTILSSMMFMDEAIVQYKTFKNSEMTYINYNNNHSEIINNEHKILNYSDLSKVSEKIDLLVEFESEVYLNFYGDEFYSNLISGIVFTEDRNNYYGFFPKLGEVMITDYHADLLIKEKLFLTKDDILNNRILINSKEMIISGIMDTDYKEYVESFDDPNFSTTNKFLEWNDKFANVYSKIYYNKVAYLNNTKEFKNYPIEYGNIFVDIYQRDFIDLNVIDQFDNVGETNCYISENLYHLLGNPDTIKIYGNVLQIKGIIAGDANEIYFIYENELLDAVSAMFSIESINLYNYSLDDIRFLFELGMVHDTPISYNLISLFRVINSLKDLFLVFSLIFLLLIGVLSFSFSRLIVVSDSKLINLSRYFGHSQINIFKFEMYKIYIYIVNLIVLSVIGSLVIANGINSYVLANVETKIVFFSPSYWIIGMIVVFSIVFMLCGFWFGFFDINKKRKKGNANF